MKKYLYIVAIIKTEILGLLNIYINANKSEAKVVPITGPNKCYL